MSAALRRSLSSLSISNYRRYFAGQLVSLSGNWMQTVAEMWLVLELTGSGVAVGVTAALQFLPMLLFGAWGGALADRLPKRSLLLATQSLMAIPALSLWALTASGGIEPWMVYGLVFARGAVNSVDNPTRQSFVIEMVGADRVVSAVGLNSTLIHSARILGPAGAGVLISTVGVAPCFLINALTFGAMIVALRAMDPAALSPAARPRDGSGGVRAAIRYVAGEPALAIPLAMMGVVGTLGFNFLVLLPLLARFSYGGGAETYTALAVAMGIGSVIGALAVGARDRVSERLMVGAAVAFGVLALLAAAAPTLPLAIAALTPLGAATVTFAAGINSTLQLGSAPEMRGRVMALYSIVFLGSTPIGGPIAGWLAEVAGPRAGLVLAGGAALAAALGGWIAFARSRDPGWRPGIAGALVLSPDPGRRRRWRLRARRAIAVEARGADQPQRLESRRGLDVEADSVAVLDRRDGRLPSAPGERDHDRVAGADRRHLGPDPAGNADAEREGADRPQPPERDPARALRRQAGRGSRRGERPGHLLGGPGRAPEPEPERCRRSPPAAGDDQRHGVGVAVGDHDRDRAERGGDAGNEQHGHPQQVAEQH
ncbi:MAG: MFS transporter [Solirubrobacterales bacterium]